MSSLCITLKGEPYSFFSCRLSRTGVTDPKALRMWRLCCSQGLARLMLHDGCCTLLGFKPESVSCLAYPRGRSRQPSKLVLVSVWPEFSWSLSAGCADEFLAGALAQSRVDKMDWHRKHYCVVKLAFCWIVSQYA